MQHIFYFISYYSIFSNISSCVSPIFIIKMSCYDRLIYNTCTSGADADAKLSILFKKIEREKEDERESEQQKHNPGGL